MTGKFAVFGHDTGERNRARQKSAGAASKANGWRRRSHADLPPVLDRKALIALALSGDSYAQWRADELYGMGWRAERVVEA